MDFLYLEVIKSFEKTSGVKLNYVIGPRRQGDIIQIYADTTLAEKELGWKAKENLDSMTLSAWKWQLKLAKK
jgi:UDP-glucose 4-epimerase